MAFDNRTRELIALGASVAANCQSCVEYHGRKAAEYGIDPAELAQAIEIGRAVRKGAAAKVDQLADTVLQKNGSSAGAPEPDFRAPGATCCGSAGGDASGRPSNETPATPSPCAPFASMMSACRSAGFPFGGQATEKP